MPHPSVTVLIWRERYDAELTGRKGQSADAAGQVVVIEHDHRPMALPDPSPGPTRPAGSPAAGHTDVRRYGPLKVLAA